MIQAPRAMHFVRGSSPNKHHNRRCRAGKDCFWAGISNDRPKWEISGSLKLVCQILDSTTNAGSTMTTTAMNAALLAPVPRDTTNHQLPILQLLTDTNRTYTKTIPHSVLGRPPPPIFFFS